MVSKSGSIVQSTTPIFKDTQILKFHDIKKLQLGKFVFLPKWSSANMFQ